MDGANGSNGGARRAPTNGVRAVQHVFERTPPCGYPIDFAAKLRLTPPSRGAAQLAVH